MSRALSEGGGCRKVPAFFGGLISEIDEPMAKPVAVLNGMGIRTTNCCCGNLEPGWRGHSSRAYFSLAKGQSAPASLLSELADSVPGFVASEGFYGTAFYAPRGMDCEFVEALNRWADARISEGVALRRHRGVLICSKAS